MFYSLRGTLIHKEPAFLVVECGGVGFKLAISMNTLSRMPERGKEVTLLTHLNVREDALDLFGFADEAEQNSFKMLTSVSGVGPKAALAILSDMTPERFALSVSAGDVKAIRQAPGIGPKIAQRIVLELKDKVHKVAESGDFDLTVLPQATRGNAAEAVNALMVLGYSHGEAASAIGKMTGDESVEEMIKHALKVLASR